MEKTYPLQITPMDCSPLVIDNGYQVVDQAVLAQWVAQLLLGNSLHISRVIEGLDSKAVNQRDKAIDSIIKYVVSLIGIIVTNMNGCAMMDIVRLRM